MTTLQELYPDEYKPEEEERKKKKRGRPKKQQQQQGVPLQGVDVVDRTGVEDPLEILK